MFDGSFQKHSNFENGIRHESKMWFFIFLFVGQQKLCFVCLNFSILIDEYPDYVNSPIYIYDGVALIVKETVHGGTNGSLLGTFYWNLWLTLLLFSLLLQILASISSKTNRSRTGQHNAIGLGATWVWEGGGGGGSALRVRF